MLENILSERGSEIAAIIINSPNNPSGAVYPYQIMKQLADIIRGYPHIGLLSFLDYTCN